jgi:hypothetical protein
MRVAREAVDQSAVCDARQVQGMSSQSLAIGDQLADPATPSAQFKKL